MSSTQKPLVSRTPDLLYSAMLNIQLASDLHLELHRDGGASFIQSMDPEGVDVLILAGDITSLRFFTQTQELLKSIAAKYPKVLYVPGNHELWRQTPAEALRVLYAASEGISNLSILNNQVISIDGRRFLGGTMWFPQWSPLYDYAATQMNDFTQIVDFYPWVVQENAKFKSFLQNNLKEGDIVVTHYLPSKRSVSPRYQGSPTNSFFMCEMDQIILDRSPALWVHGHTHDSCDYQFSKTRIVCNPFGYPKDLNHGYVEKKLIRVE
jgi:predicted phosphodiesterase